MDLYLKVDLFKMKLRKKYNWLTMFLGSNILLQRLMIQNNKIESISLVTFDSEINPCGVTYVIRILS